MKQSPLLLKLWEFFQRENFHRLLLLIILFVISSSIAISYIEPNVSVVNAFWWSIVTMTTVGYGDKTPKGNIGRLFGLVWILAGYFVFAYFTASVTSTVTVQELHGTINGPEDLFGKRVATVARSTASEYLSEQGVAPVEFANADEAYRYLETGKVDAVVYDAPVLQHYASHQGRGRVHVVGLIFQEKSYGIALPIRSAIRDEVNIALLEIIEEGVYQELREKWFGS